MKYLCTGLIAAVALTGCVTPQQRVSGTNQNGTSAPGNIARHTYSVSVIGADGAPIDSADAKFTLSVNMKNVNPQSCITKADGSCSVTVDVPQDSAYKYTVVQASSASISVSKKGYYTETKSNYNNALSTAKNFEATKITLLKPLDYLTPEFASSLKDKNIRDQALAFVSEVRLGSLLVSTDLVPKTMGTSQFKGKHYFAMKLISSTVYNSLKVDKYGMGKQLFDDSIRKILNPLNDKMRDVKAYHGYDITVIGLTRSFAEKYSSPEAVTYRFILPQSAVAKYKAQDISGQQLIDSSIVLMNDERIDLKLQ